jgi:hypothetical protein
MPYLEVPSSPARKGDAVHQGWYAGVVGSSRAMNHLPGSTQRRPPLRRKTRSGSRQRPRFDGFRRQVGRRAIDVRDRCNRSSSHHSVVITGVGDLLTGAWGLWQAASTIGTGYESLLIHGRSGSVGRFPQLHEGTGLRRHAPGFIDQAARPDDVSAPSARSPVWVSPSAGTVASLAQDRSGRIRRLEASVTAVRCTATQNASTRPPGPPSATGRSRHLTPFASSLRMSSPFSRVRGVGASNAAQVRPHVQFEALLEHRPQHGLQRGWRSAVRESIHSLRSQAIRHGGMDFMTLRPHPLRPARHHPRHATIVVAASVGERDESGERSGDRQLRALDA